MNSRPGALGALCALVYLLATYACDDSTDIVPNPSPCVAGAEVVDFDTVSVGNYRADLFWIRFDASGHSPVTTQCPHFRLPGDNTLFPNQTLPQVVIFEPLSAGRHACAVPECDVEFDTATHPTLTGFAVEPHGCALSTTLIDFGPVTVGNTRDTIFTVTNVGYGELSRQWTVTCPEVSVIATFPDNTTYADEGETDTVTVRFRPVVAGALNCTIKTQFCDSILVTGIGE